MSKVGITFHEGPLKISGKFVAGDIVEMSIPVQEYRISTRGLGHIINVKIDKLQDKNFLVRMRTGTVTAVVPSIVITDPVKGVLLGMIVKDKAANLIYEAQSDMMIIIPEFERPKW